MSSIDDSRRLDGSTASVGQSVRVFSLTFAEDDYSGAQQVNAREILSRLDPRHFDCTLLSDGGGPARIAQRPNVRLLRLPPSGRTLVLMRHLLAHRPDIVLYPHFKLLDRAYLRLPRWLRGRRTRVLLPVEGDTRQFLDPAWYRRRVASVFRRVDALFPITPYVAETLGTHFGLTGEVVPVGVDLEAFSPRQGDRRPGPLRILSVGSMKSWKRPEFVRFAAERIPEVEFTWIGDGPLLAGERALAPRSLRFLGAVPQRELLPHYRDADVFLHTGAMEGLPKVILEAVACGLPVVAFDDYRPTFLSEGGAGFVVGGREEMIEALRTLDRSEEVRTSMARSAREVAARYSWDDVAAVWADVFRRHAGRPPP